MDKYEDFAIQICSTCGCIYKKNSDHDCVESLKVKIKKEEDHLAKLVEIAKRFESCLFVELLNRCDEKKAEMIIERITLGHDRSREYIDE